MKTKSFFERGTAANRNLLALIILPMIIIAIVVISYFYFVNNKSDSGETSEKIFNALLPLFATWVGTVLAFYFGRENFEAATNKYDQIIDKLNPEILDDVAVDQIMITRKTMVVKQYTSDLSSSNLNDLINFLKDVDKTRLPILDGEKIKYIVHSSTFLKAKNEGIQTFSDFENRYESIITSFDTIVQGEILERVLLLFKQNSNIKDVFIIDNNQSVKGWLTDTLVMRYLKS